MGSEKSTRYGECESMSQILSKTIIKVCHHWFAVITSFFVLESKSNFSIFRGIELKFGGGVNSVTLISYFMSILPYN